MRASLFASATETRRNGFFSSNPFTQSVIGVGCRLASLMTAVAPTTSKRLSPNYSPRRLSASACEGPGRCSSR